MENFPRLRTVEIKWGDLYAEHDELARIIENDIDRGYYVVD